VIFTTLHALCSFLHFSTFRHPASIELDPSFCHFSAFALAAARKSRKAGKFLYNCPM
jgi:hypothetical protein